MQDPSLATDPKSSGQGPVDTFGTRDRRRPGEGTQDSDPVSLSGSGRPQDDGRTREAGPRGTGILSHRRTDTPERDTPVDTQTGRQGLPGRGRLGRENGGSDVSHRGEVHERPRHRAPSETRSDLVTGGLRHLGVPRGRHLRRGPVRPGGWDPHPRPRVTGPVTTCATDPQDSQGHSVLRRPRRVPRRITTRPVRVLPLSRGRDLFAKNECTRKARGLRSSSRTPLFPTSSAPLSDRGRVEGPVVGGRVSGAAGGRAARDRVVRRVSSRNTGLDRPRPHAAPGTVSRRETNVHCRRRFQRGRVFTPRASRRRLEGRVSQEVARRVRVLRVPDGSRSPGPPTWCPFCSGFRTETLEPGPNRDGRSEGVLEARVVRSQG